MVTVRLLHAGCCVCLRAGYVGTSGLSGVMYRSEDAPGLGFLLKKSFYEQHMQKHMDTCCMKRSVEILHAYLLHEKVGTCKKTWTPAA